jgi:hypothetical protein
LALDLSGLGEMRELRRLTETVLKRLRFGRVDMPLLSMRSARLAPFNTSKRSEEFEKFDKAMDQHSVCFLDRRLKAAKKAKTAKRYPKP